MATKHFKVISICAIAFVAIGVFFAFRSDGSCPVELPKQYELVAHFEGLNTADLALELKSPSFPPSMGLGTAQDWLFEASGSKDDAAWPLLMHLRKTGNWRQLPSRSQIIYSDDGRSPKVVMFSDRSNPTKHFVRVNGKWRTPGIIEEAVSKLPASWVSRFKSKR